MSKRPQASPALPSLAKKRRAQQNKEEKVVLERVLGLTCVSSSGLAACGVNGCIAYPAGFITVLYLPKKNRQLHILNASRKPISCLCLSSDGKYLATGESGHQPCVRVWDISSSPTQVAELKGHTHGISCVAFSPNLKYLVSVGYQHDMTIHVWSWKSGTSVASNKTTKVTDLAFSDSGSYFVTVGNRRVRFWYLDIAKDGRLNRTSPLKGRSAVLGDLQDNCFVGVSCGRGSLGNSTYALTQSGLLCLFDASRRLDKFTEVKASPARCLAVSEQYLFSGGSDGVVRIFDPYTLDYLTTLPRPHSLGVNIAAALDVSQFSGNGEKYPDTTAIAMDDVNKRLTVVYNDHSLYIWDLTNVRQIGKTNSFLYHSACIWDVCTYPRLEDKSKGLLPEGCFVTSSSDNTIRFWCLDSSQEASGFIRNIYSKELMKIIYTETDVSFLKDLSKKPGDASVVADMSRGVRSIQFHPEGQHLAVGDRAGNLRVYDLQFMDEIFEVEAHDSEVLCIEYSPAFDDLQFLATSSRDRLMHVFTVNDGYHHLQTIDDHSASITSIKFTAKDSLNIQLLSCGADKSIMFRTLEKNPDPSFHMSNHIVGKATIYDMDIDAVGKHIVTAGQDKMLRIYSIATGKQKSVVKPPAGEDGSFIKVTLDPSGLYAAASGADKAISLFDFYSGECLARLYGHSEVVTQMRFSKDCKRLYSVSGDSCIFVWRLSRELTQTMHDRLAEIGRPVSPSAQLTPTKTPQDSRRDTYSVPHPLAKKRGRGTDQTDSGEGESDVDSGVDSASFRLSVSQLPSWAQKQVMTRPSIAGNIGARALERATEVGGQSRATPLVPVVGGRWAQRVAEVQFASEGQEAGVVRSDTEKEEATPKAVDKQDLAVIDLTESEEGNGNEDDSRVTVRGEEYLEEVVEDCEEEIIYPTAREGAADVDPSAFHVTTPVKQSRSETDGAEEQRTDDSDATPDNSPALEKKESFEFHAQEEEDEVGSFLRTNFVTLSAEKVEQFLSSQPLDPYNPRLSISARFFSGRKERSHTVGLPSIAYVDASPKLETYAPQEDAKIESTGTDSDPNPAKSGSKPTQSDSSSPPHSICSSQLELPQSSDESKKLQEDVSHDQTSERSSVSVAEKGKSRKQRKKSKTSGVSSSASADDCRKKSEKIQSDIPRSKSEVLISSTLGEQPQKQHQESQHQSAKASKRRGSIEEEISKTKKRLEQLGYSISGKDSEAKHAAAAMAPAASHKTVRVKPRKSQEKTPEPVERIEPAATESAETHSKPELEDPSELLLSRVNVHIEQVNEHFKAIAELHDEAVQGMTQEGNRSRSDCEDTITAVATAINLLKSQVSTMANKHRRMWRGKDRSSGYNLRATPVSTPERELCVDTPRSHTSLSSNLKTKMTAVSKLAEVALADPEGSESLEAVFDPGKSEKTEGGAADAITTPEEESSSPNSATTLNTGTVSVSTDNAASDVATQDFQDILEYSEQLVQFIKQKMHKTVGH